jgi:hypothetical protein
MCQILGLDFAAIETEAVKAIPQPKSWAGLDEERTPQTSEVPACSDESDPTASSTPSQEAEPAAYAEAV